MHSAACGFTQSAQHYSSLRHSPAPATARRTPGPIFDRIPPRTSDPVRPAVFDQPKSTLAPRLLPPDLLPPPEAAAEARREGDEVRPLRRRGEARGPKLAYSGWARCLLRNFGDNRSGAYEARRLVAELRLTELAAPSARRSR